MHSNLKKIWKKNCKILINNNYIVNIDFGTCDECGYDFPCDELYDICPMVQEYYGGVMGIYCPPCYNKLNAPKTKNAKKTK